MAGKQLNTKILAVRIIPNADPMLLKNLDVRPGDKSLGIFTTDCDDVSYTAVDEATKKADVHVAYAKSMYAGFWKCQHGTCGRVYRDPFRTGSGGSEKRTSGGILPDRERRALL